MRWRLGAFFSFAVILLYLTVYYGCSGKGEFRQIPAELIRDKIRGGLMGQLLGNLNGLPHEMQYIDEPGNAESYRPELPDGARTDDDTDIEWVYVTEIEKGGGLFLSPERIVTVWKTHINRSIWCANRYARGLMDLGIEPPMTGWSVLNPWSEFNISGQFVAECFGLVSPGMPKTAAELGLHYTRVAIDGEPAQATQLFTAMIAGAFIENDIAKIIAAGLSAVDKKSEVFRIVTDVYGWRQEHPQDWRTVRRLIKEKYSRHGGGMRDRNGFELNTASTIAALLFGGGEFTETLRLAFNFGWDADNNAATAGTILGVILGKRWMDGQGWNIRDAYTNTTRDAMPEDETITRFGNRLIAVAELVIGAKGGAIAETGDETFYSLPVEKPVNVEPLSGRPERMETLKKTVVPQLEKGIAGSMLDRARAAYLAIVLGEAERLRQTQPIAWGQAIELLAGHPAVLDNIFEAPEPAGSELRTRAIAEGLHIPLQKK